MKRRFTILTAALALLVSLAFPMGMRGQTLEDVTLSNGTFSTDHITWTCANGNISITQLKGTSTNAVNSNYISAPRLYKGHILSFEGSNDYTITNISITYTGNYMGNSMTAGTVISDNVVTDNTTDVDRTWATTTNGGVHQISSVSEDGLPAIHIQNVASSTNVQLRPTAISVTYIGSGTTPDTFTVTFDAGDGTFVPSNDFANTSNDVVAGTYTLPTATREGYTFDGWTITGDTQLYNGSYIVSDDVDFTAAYTENTTPTPGGPDVLNWAATGSPTNYTDWTYTAPSGAVYKGQSSGTYQSIQLRSTNNNSGIVTTTSAGKVTNISVTWNSNTASGRTLNVYGKNSAYSAATDLYGNNAGTLIGTIVCGTSTELVITDDYEYIGMRSANNAMYLDEIQITWESATPALVATPTFNPASGAEFGNDGLQVTISCETTGARIYYTLDGSTPDDGSNYYQSAITLTETTTIKAIAYDSDDNISSVATATYTYVDPNGPGTQNNPYTVAQARDAIDAGTGLTDVYATGIVSAIPTAWSTQYNNITFNFVDTAGDTDYLQAYRCVSGTGVDASTVAVGDIVVVYGNLTKYGTTYEFGSGCQLVSLTHPVITTPTVTVTPNTINAPFEGATGTLAITYENIPDLISFDYYFCNATGEELLDTDPDYPDWIEAEINEENDVYSVTYTIIANQGAARTAYFKVYTMDTPNQEEAYAIVTVNQAEYVAPTYAELPFEFDGGRADIENTDGLYQEGLGSDYSSSPKLKFDGAGDYVLLQFEERPGTLTFDIKGNGSGSDPWAGEFKVQVSTNGIDYIDKVVYVTGDLTSTKTTMTIDDLAADVRYIKWVYVTKTLGNVALGNINLAAYQAPVASITVTPDEVNVDADEHDGTLALTYENMTITDMTDFDIQYYDAQGEEANEPDWVEVLVAEQDPAIGEGYVVSYYMIENDGDARTAYFKVYAMDAETNLVYSNLVTVTQAAPVAPAYYVCSENGVAGEPVEVTTPGTTVTLAPGQDLNSDFTFAGWTDDEDNVDQLITEFTPEAGTSYAFYAVYAHTTGGARTASSTMTIDATTENFPTAYGDANTFTEHSLNGVNFKIQQAFISGQKLQFRAAGNSNGTGTIYNNESLGTISSIILNYDSSDSKKNFTVTAGSEANPTQGTSITPSINGNVYTFDLSDGNYSYFVLTNGENAGYLTSIIINYSDGTPTPALTTAYYTRVFIDETVEGDIEIVGPSIVPSGEILDMGSYELSNGLDAAHLIIEDGAQVKTASSFVGTIQKVIEGYGAENTESSDGYYLFASPIDAMDPANVNGLITNDPYDLYTYDAEGDDDGNEWINQEDQNNDSFILQAFHGYLYASQNGTTLNFAGEMNTTDMMDLITIEGVELAYGDDDIQRYTLVGNSFTYEFGYWASDVLGYEKNVYYLTLNSNHNGFICSTLTNSITLQPMEAVLVYAPESDMYFNGDNYLKKPVHHARPGNLNVRINCADGSLLDNTIITFGNGSMMRKLYLNNTSTRVYIPVEDNEYAAVCAQAQGEMPVNFRAERNSSYVISVDAENVDMNYLHLIDNLTGADIDLLANPSYTFEANTHDYASRFRLVFSAEDNGENANANFAFFDGSQWIITNTGEATLQVVDVMGRVLSTETVNGNVSLNLNQTPGVYMLRLINGDNVNVQKVVVR